MNLLDKNHVELQVGDTVKVNQPGGGSGTRYSPSCCAKGTVRSVDQRGCYVDFDKSHYPDDAYVCIPKYIEKLEGHEKK